jgi:hypothetical protein
MKQLNRRRTRNNLIPFPAQAAPPPVPSSLDLLPEVDWRQPVLPAWSVDRDNEFVVIQQGGNLITIRVAELPRLLASLYGLGA